MNCCKTHVIYLLLVKKMRDFPIHDSSIAEIVGADDIFYCKMKNEEKLSFNYLYLELVLVLSVAFRFPDGLRAWRQDEKKWKYFTKNYHNKI